MEANTNTAIIVSVLCGIYLFSNKKTDNDDEVGDNHLKRNMPYVVVAVILYTMKDEIKDNFSMDRVYTFAACTSSAYMITIEASLIHVMGAVFFSLFVLPVLLQKNDASS